jgi:hypothetical protein
MYQTGSNIAAVWNRNPSPKNDYTVSLRFRDGQHDVKAIAKAIAGENGGRHPQAAGFTVPDILPFLSAFNESR